MKPFTPPKLVLDIAWGIHRRIARRGPGRGLWEPGTKRGDSWGALTLITTGARSGEERRAIVAFHIDDGRFHLLAMNGWQEGHPAWWHNLAAEPAAEVERADGSRTAVVAHLADGEERERLWRVWSGQEPKLDELAAHRATPTDVVVLTPR